MLLSGSMPGLAQENPQIKTKDFNQDGYVDSLITTLSRGSGFGGKTISLIDGKNGNSFKMESKGCYCQIKQIITIPPALNQAQTSHYKEVILADLLPPMKNQLDPSLSWLIEANNNHHRLKDHPYFDLIIYPKIDWKKGDIQLPDTYTINVITEKNGQNQQIISTLKEKTSKDKLLVYFGHNHFSHRESDSLKHVVTNKSYKIFKTAHGILAKKGNRFKWLFINDYALFEGPEKLRWPSIGFIQVVGEFLIFQHHLTPGMEKNIFVIHLESGICGRYKHKCVIQKTIDKTKGSAFSITSSTIQLFVEGERLSYRTTDFLNSLERARFSGN